MKKLTVLFLAVLLIISLFACQTKTEESVTVRVGGLKGATSIGLAKLRDEAENGTSENSYEFTLAGSADELVGPFSQGNIDIMAIPANLASILYKKTAGNLVVLAINNLGVLYIVSKNEEITSVSDLKGKTIYATGKGTTPEYSLRYILTENGIDPENDVNIEWKSEASEVVAVLSEAESGIAMLPQPYVTVAKTKIPELETVIDFTEEWKKIGDGSELVTGVVVANKEFAEKYPETVKKFLEEYRKSAENVSENLEETAELTEKYIGIKAAIGKTAIPECNITYIDGSKMKEILGKYIEILYNMSPETVGAIPDDGFYYEK